MSNSVVEWYGAGSSITRESLVRSVSALVFEGIAK
jgi:hypothetical protein